MAKDPAFLFYSNDFLSGTMFFTDDQVGKYIRLLIAQHQHGHLSEKHMLHICKTYDADIFAKFVLDENSFYYNEKLEVESAKRKNFSESRKANRKGKTSDISTTYVKHMSTHMENENENRNVNELKDRSAEGRRTDLTDSEIRQTIEFCHLTQQRKYLPERITELWKGFLITSDGEVYLNPSKQLSHFRNWIKNQPYETAKRTTADTARPGSVRAAI